MNFVTVMTLFNYGLVLIYGILLAVDISGGAVRYIQKKINSLPPLRLQFFCLCRLLYSCLWEPRLPISCIL